jgi:hypothetical protein
MRSRTIMSLAVGGVLLASTVGVGLAAASPASAHTPDFEVTCTSASIDLTNYPAGSTVSGTLDGVDLGTITFGAEGYHGHTALDPAVPHEWNIVVKSGDGNHRYDVTYAGKSDPSCIPVVPPTEPPTPVVVPLVQDYVTCDGGAFVLDNTGSNEDVTYTVNGVSFPVPAGKAVHTDADGTLIQPTADLGGYLVTAGDRSWTFPAAGDCGTTVPTTPVPVTGSVTLSITADDCTASPKIVTWDIPDGLAIGGVTGSGSTVDTEATILNAAIGGSEHPRSWILPITVLDGFSYDGPDTVTLTQEVKSCPTTPPTGEPTTPAPSDGPTTVPTDSPSPTAGTTPPATSPAAPSTPRKSSTTAAPVAADTSRGTGGELAYTGISDGTKIAALLALGLLAAGGAVYLIVRTGRRRAEIRDGE